MAKMLRILLGLTLILAVACGSAAEPTAAPDPTATQAADTAPTTAPAPVVAETPQPTPVPLMVDPPTQTEVNPGKLTIMVANVANERFDLVFNSGEGWANYGRTVHGFLISDNEKKEMVPGIATEWGLSEDGLMWEFTIREGVKWHDGTELVPEDVLWTLQHHFGPQANEYATDTGAASISRASISRMMDRIELSGPNEVSLITKAPITNLADRVSEAGGYSFHVLPGRATLHDEAEELAYDSNPIGAGPMSLKNHVPAQVMEFERFDDFYYQPANGFSEDKRVNFESLDLFLVPEEATRVAALRSGEADIVPASLATKEQVEAGGGRLVFSPEGVYVWALLMGCYDPQYPCHDKRVRQALDYAIDKKEIQSFMGGPEVFQVKGWTFATPSTIGYTPELDPWPFDPDKARELLADAGYPNGEGFGKLIVNTFPATGMPLQVEMAQLAAEFWKRELGLDVEVRVGDTTALRQNEVAGRLNGQILWRDNETRRDTTALTVSRYGDPKIGGQAHNDPELFRMVQGTFRIVDADKRAEATEKLYLRLREESYQLGIGYANIPWGVGPRVTTWEPYPLSGWPSALHTITLNEN
jgi:peptide/nickel transport system substrate-binding protein